MRRAHAHHDPVPHRADPGDRLLVRSYAHAALQGILASRGYWVNYVEGTDHGPLIAERAFEIAKAMVEAEKAVFGGPKPGPANPTW